MKRLNKFKKGAASFYIVAISTLILVIIAASFAAVIISEVTRTSNKDLAQSAYDSALAGVEDGKLAYYNYLQCVDGAEYVDSGLSCSVVKELVENPDKTDCDMVATILDRNIVRELGVRVEEDGDSRLEGNINENNMQQYYTCVKVTNKTKDVLGGLSESNPEYVVRVRFDGVENEDIKSVRISWHSDEDGDKKEFRSANYSGEDYDDEGLFEKKEAKPAVIALGMIQTSENFSLADFERTVGWQTNRGTVYLVPDIDGCDKIATMMNGGTTFQEKDCHAEDDRFWDVTKEGNKIPVEGFLGSNDKTFTNLPFLVKCNASGDYACYADVAIPEPVGGDRSDDTFIFSVSLPYGGPKTHFSLEFFCDSEKICSSNSIVDQTTGGETSYNTVGQEVEEEVSNQAILDNVQVSIDSTGRANDLYRRVETRLEPYDIAYPFPSYAVQALGQGSGDEAAIVKNFYTICEYNFGSWRPCGD